MDLSTSSGRKFLPEICVKTGQFLLREIQAYDLFSPAELAAIAAPLVIVSLGYFEWSLFQDPVDDSKTAAVLIPPKISADGPPVNPSFMDTPGLEQRPSES